MLKAIPKVAAEAPRDLKKTRAKGRLKMLRRTKASPHTLLVGSNQRCPEEMTNAVKRIPGLRRGARSAWADSRVQFLIGLACRIFFRIYRSPQGLKCSPSCKNLGY